MTTPTKKTATPKPVRAKSEPLPAITVKDLETAIDESRALVEEAEALAPSGLVTQKMQLAKVRIKHAAELLEALKP
jgi:hypothetical protein